MSTRTKKGNRNLRQATACTALRTRHLVERLETRVLLSTIYVDASAPAPAAHDGTSWGTAYLDLQQALTAAVSGDQIHVANGTYKPTSGTDRTISFQLKNGVSMMGGYAGYGAADPDARDVVANPAILSGDIGVAGNSSDNSYHMVVGSGRNSTAIIDGFTITGGAANGSSNNQFGGGMYDSSGSPSVSNCIFSGNTATSGGGMYNTTSSSPTLTNCTFSRNTASSRGGGLYNISSSSPSLTNCTFSANSAFDGGGIYNSSSSPTLTNCTLSGNMASASGNGMRDTFSSPTLTNCIVWGSGSSPIYDDSSSPTITFCDIQGGYAGIGNFNADPQFVRSPWTGPDGVFGTADDDSGDVRLRTGSPALNVGSNSAIPAGITTDLAGNPRIQDGTVDLGAYEGASTPAAPKLIYVDSSAVGANNGTSWANAFTSLSSAILTASDADTIRVGDGTYKPTTSTDRTFGFALKNGMSIYGGYPGYGAANPDARDIIGNPTILSGNIGVTGSNTDNSFHVLVAVGIGGVTLDGMTITLGCANGSNTDPQTGAGAGFFSRSSLLVTLANCTFSGNQASDGGAGMYGGSSSATLINCTFSGNTASAGGGMYNSFSSPTLTNCIFTGNTGSSGGAMFNYPSSSPTLTNCTFSGNTASQSGGGMFNSSSSSPTLTDCTFSRNTATYEGGGMYNESSCSPTLTDCAFIGNTVSGSGDGGGMYNWDSCSPTLANCTFSGNTASSRGGGMFNNTLYSSPTLTNCTFSGNASSSGGGMYNGTSSPTLTNCTFTENTGSSGGGIYNTSSSSPLLTNCVIWNSGNGPIYNDYSSTSTITYSDIQGGYAGIGNLNADPQFVRSPWTGPDGFFGTVDDDSGDLRLRAGSPALNVGSNPAIPAGITTDLAGNPRIQDGTVDLGAYEGFFNAPAPKLLYVDLNAIGAGNGTSWANAFTTLSSAILVAIDGDTIRIADGTYKPTTSTDRTLGFALKNGLSLSGGYAGFGAADSNLRNIVSFPTILSGDIGVGGSNIDNTYHVLTAMGIGSATVDGMTITLGYANGTGTAQSIGAGLFNRSSLLTLANCTLNRNTAAYDGGGMYSDSSSPTLTNCTFSGNTVSSGSGGAMFSDSCSSTLTNCIFSGNRTSWDGAAMLNSSSSLVLTNCTLAGNVALAYGDGMFNDSSSVTLTNCIVWGNGTSPIGSAIYNSSSTPTISYCDIQGGYGGAANLSTDPLFVDADGLDGIYGTADDNLRLQATSLCLEGGNNAAVPVGLETDADGDSRFVEIPGIHDPGAVVDMGAYERQSALAATSGSFVVDGPQPAVRLTMNNVLVPSSIATGDVLVRTVLPDGSLGSTIPVSGFSYDPATRSVSFNLPVSLADGNYRATLLAGSVSDTYANAPAADYSFDFFSFAADANQDRVVDIKDLAILTANWGGTGKVFSQGDFNYEGKVDSIDLGILASRWQGTLSTPAPAAPASVARAPSRAATRVITQVM